MRTTLLALVLTTSLVSLATADDAKKLANDDCAKARAANKTCVIDMGNEKIDGEVPKNDDLKIDVIKFTGTNSLIHLRRDFIPEIIKTAEDL